MIHELLYVMDNLTLKVLFIPSESGTGTTWDFCRFVYYIINGTSFSCSHRDRLEKRWSVSVTDFTHEENDDFRRLYFRQWSPTLRFLSWPSLVVDPWGTTLTPSTPWPQDCSSSKLRKRRVIVLTGSFVALGRFVRCTVKINGRGHSVVNNVHYFNWHRDLGVNTPNKR